LRAKEGFGEGNAGERGFNQIQGNGNCRAYRFREHVSVIEGRDANGQKEGAFGPAGIKLDRKGKKRLGAHRSAKGARLHEIGIAPSMLDGGRGSSQAPWRKNHRGGLANRDLSSISPDALTLAFEALTRETPWENLKVEIEWFPRRQKCQVCGEEFPVADFEMVCPKCGDGRSTCIGGTEAGYCVPGAGGVMREAVEKKVLSENNRLAAALRQRYRDEGILCVNLVSSPGSGKTALLEKTLETFPKDTAVAVLNADLQTDNDARRLARYGFPVRQIVTGGTCHLDARMVDHHLNETGFHGPEVLFIENVGNLVCPSSCDLGEAAKIVLLSVTEGEDRPLKYPGIFHRSALMILTKTDLLAHVEFSAELALENARKIHPEIDTIALSACTGEGLDLWMAWLGALQQKVRHQAAAAIT